jgi:hypothetical protein
VAGLIVIGNQGLGSRFRLMGRFLMGSVLEKVTRCCVIRKDLYRPQPDLYPIWVQSAMTFSRKGLSEALWPRRTEASATAPSVCLRRCASRSQMAICAHKPSDGPLARTGFEKEAPYG